MTSFIKKIRSVSSPAWNRWLNWQRLQRFLKVTAAHGIELNPVTYDIGARWGISPPFHLLSKWVKSTTVGFEPDLEEAARLRDAKAFNIVVGKALGAREELRTLYIAADPGSSSIYPPDLVEIARHTTSPQFRTAKQIEIAVERLDVIAEREQLPPPDYLKIDCEGAEGEILEGAGALMQKVTGVLFEARFVEFYKGGSILSSLTDRFFSEGFICLNLKPGGAFFGASMMFDVLMIRHPDNLLTQRQFLNAILLCFLFGKWTYAARISEIRGSDFGFPELSRLLERR